MGAMGAMGGWLMVSSLWPPFCPGDLPMAHRFADLHLYLHFVICLILFQERQRAQ
jgi:hypothetical protein